MSPLDLSVALQERPPCPKCHSPMFLAAVTSGPAGIYTRKFECVVCKYTEKVVTAVEIPKAGVNET
jgi:ribosomal protein S27AE